MDTLAELNPTELAPLTRGRRRLVVSVVFGLLLGIILIRADVHANQLAPAIPAWIAALLLHESGHLTAALLARETVIGFAVWPVAFDRAGGRWRVSFGPRGFGGYVRVLSCVPDARRRRLAIVAGGPVASAIACGVCFTTARHGGHPLLMWIGAISAAFLFFSLAPAQPGGPLPDFDQFTTLLENGPDARFLLAGNRIFAESAMGVRPRDWPDIPQRETPDEVRSAIACGWWILRYDRAVDLGAFEEAETALVNALRSAINPVTQSTLRYAAAWFAAYVRHDRETAEKWFSSVPVSLEKGSALTHSLALAALSLLRGQSEAALTAIRQADKAACENPPGLRIVFEETLGAMAREAEAQLRGAAASTSQR